MSILSWIKGKKKQREMRNITPDKEFEFKKDYYGISENESINGFKFIYCNNYTDKLFNNGNKQKLSFISCVISLSVSEKVLKDLAEFMNTYISKKIDINEYKNLHVEFIDNNVNLYLRGNLQFYETLCDHIHNNIFTRYIRNNIFPNELPIETPNEFLNNIYNSITHPLKEVDILFIENDLCKAFKPVIGLSMTEDNDHIFLDNFKPLYYNRRDILYCEINKLSNDEIDYLINKVKYGNILQDVLHKGIEVDDIDSEIDEIIEE